MREKEAMAETTPCTYGVQAQGPYPSIYRHTTDPPIPPSLPRHTLIECPQGAVLQISVLKDCPASVSQTFGSIKGATCEAPLCHPCP